MDCKHLKVAGNTTKYYYCKAKDKEIDMWECQSCPLRLKTRQLDIINTIFNSFKGK